MKWKDEFDNEYKRNEDESKFKKAWEERKQQAIKAIKQDFIKYFEENGANCESSKEDEPFGRSVLATYRGKKILLKLEKVGLTYEVNSTSMPIYYCELTMDYTQKNILYCIMLGLRDKISGETIEQKIDKLVSSDFTFSIYSKKGSSGIPISDTHKKYDTFYEALKNEL